MNLNEYQKAALRTAPFESISQKMLHAQLGLMTEIGEFLTEVKRISRYAKPMSDDMRKHMLEELGDTMWYVALGADGLAVTLQECHDFTAFFAVNPDSESPLTHHLEAASVNFGCELGLFSLWVYELGENDEVLGNKATPIKALSSIIRVAEYAVKALGADFGEVLQANIDKLQKRYPDKYSHEAAEARADKDGLSALVS